MRNKMLWNEYHQHMQGNYPDEPLPEDEVIADEYRDVEGFEPLKKPKPRPEDLPEEC